MKSPGAGAFGRAAAKILLLMNACLAFAFSGSEINEYEVKAMFIINFVKYVDWSSYENETAIKIGIAGHSEITSALEEMAASKKENSKQIKIVRIDPEKPERCNIIFVARSESKRLPQLAKEFLGKGVLLVSEDNKSKSRLAGINLIRTDNKIKFEINQTSIKQSGLRLSSQLNLLAAVLNP